MRRLWLIVLVALVGGCSNGLAARQAELAQWVGKPETNLLAVMGAPTRTYEAGGMKFLTYDDRQVQILPGSPYFGAGLWNAGGIPPTVMTLVCETTFTIADGIVRSFSLRGNACG
ncbi:MAG: hypothetical protein QOF70_5048 [Acetobacteraceae bacterium]|jgi:hypothetical protein|nr:hypothetical protein [Rhodopila sp.]MEA2730573.1 hypothetical protein [Acetobacteraceae bacterium]